MPSTNRTSSVASHSSTSEPVELVPGSTHYSLSRAVQERKDEYVRPHRIRVKVGSWNVAACPGTDKDLASWFVDGKGLEPKFDANLAGLNANDSDVVEENVIEDPSNSISKPKEGIVAEETTVAGHGKDGEASQDSNTSFKQDPNAKYEDPSIRLVGGSDVGLYVLGLQEVISLNLVTQSLYSDPSIMARWQAALEAALPKDYTLIASQQLSGLLLLIYASPEVAATISNTSTVSVGTGLMSPWGYLGNKGGVSSRLVLGQTTRMVFTNCHLASGHEQANLERRCWDYNRILSQTQFSPVNHGGVLEDESEKLGEEDFSFWFGDLNYRLDGLPGNDIRRLLMLHTRGEYDLNKKETQRRLDEEGVIVMQNNDKKDSGEDESSNGSDTPGMISRETSFDKPGDDDDAELPDPDDFIPDPHDDPASLQATLDSLLPHDQLRRVIKQRKAFHEGWREGPITFLPSYKYDVGTVGLFDSSEKRRAPSWCDRILFRTRRDLDAYTQKCVDEIEAKKKDEDMKQRGIDTAADDESVLFDYDPDKDSSSNDVAGDGSYEYDEYDEGADDEANSTVITKDGFKDRIKLDIYTTHQRITSSDHKPIVALFTLDYDAVVPELKAKVHTEVARELDRAENEGRPGITIVVDGKEGAPNENSKAEDERDVTDGSGGVNFGNTTFLQLQQRSLTIANTGGVPATVSFVDKPGTEDEDTSDPSSKSPDSEWLKVSLRHAANYSPPNQEAKHLAKIITLEPGDTISALLTVQVSSIPHLQALNAGKTTLDEVLVLRVANGRDHFIPVHADWLPSSFGRSLEELIRIPSKGGGIRGFLQNESEKKANDGKSWKGGSIPHSLPTHASSPAELYKLTGTIETLAERSIADENMLEDAEIPRDKVGWPFDSSSHGASKDTKLNEEHTHVDRDEYLAKLIEALDTDAPLLEAFPADLPALVRLEIASSTLLLFLRSLVDGIITAPLWATIEVSIPTLSIATITKVVQDIESEKSTVLDILSGAPYHNISFVFITAMLSKVASEILPLSPTEVQVLSEAPARTPASKRKSIGAVRRSMSFRKSTSSSGPEGVNEASIVRRLMWERRAAELFGPAVCRAGSGGESASDKERKAVEERMKVLIEIFLRRERG